MSANNIAKEQFEDGMSEFVNGNYDSSIQYFTSAIDVDADFTLALKSRGAAYLKSNRVPEAIVDFYRLIQLDPDNAGAYHLRGLAYEKTGDLGKALVDFNHSIEHNPNYGAAYFSRATLHTKMGDTDQATADMKMVTHLTEVNIETFANENNVWRSRHLQMENIMETEMNR